MKFFRITYLVIFGFLIVVLTDSCVIKHGIIDYKFMDKKPEVIITDKYVVLKASSSLINSAASIYKIKYNIKDKTLKFCAIDGVLLFGNSKDSILIKIKKFKNVSPMDFSYFYINPDSTNIKIEPKNK